LCRLGLHQAGIHPVLAIEHDKHAVATYEKNFPDTRALCGDICHTSFKKYRGSVDLVVGGPPCQPFSVAGNQRSFEDPRDMIPQFFRVLSEVKPSCFMLENVAGLASLRHRAYLNRAIERFESLGYFVCHKIINSALHGVPQDRKRLIIFGSQFTGFEFPKASHGPSGRYPFLSAGEALANVPEDEPNKAIVTYAKKPVLRPSPFAGMLVNGRGSPIDLNRTSQTIPASAGGNSTHIVDPDQILVAYHEYLCSGGKPRRGLVDGVRRLTIRESARLQTFPDSFEFEGTRSAQYSQIGNAVPPKLALSLAKTIQVHFSSSL